jgi:hypothetical protein
MKEATKRSIFRWIHIIFAIPIFGYIYSPFEKLPDYAPATRFVFLPVMVLTGIVDVEGPRPSTTCFEKIGPTKCGLAVFDARLYIRVRRVDQPA